MSGFAVQVHNRQTGTVAFEIVDAASASAAKTAALTRYDGNEAAGLAEQLISSVPNSVGAVDTTSIRAS